MRATSSMARLGLRWINLSPLLALALGCSNYAVLKLPSSTDKMSSGSVDNATFKSAGIVGTSDAVPADADCKLWLWLRTWDHLVQSNAVCIKHGERPIAIPERILLHSDGVTKVNRHTYCADDDATIADNACVWNRKFFNNYPIGFMISTSREASDSAAPPLSRHVSLVRVVRNGKQVFRWSSDETPSKVTLEIPSSAITVPESFRDPVDLGLYILESGVDQTKVAAVSAYEKARSKWGETLGKAVLSAATSPVPAELKDAYTCFTERFRYLRARVRRDTAEASQASDAMKSLADRYTRLGDAYAKSPKVLKVATDQPVDLKVVKTIDGVALSENDKVLLLNADGTRGQIFEVHPGKAPVSIGTTKAGALHVPKKEGPGGDEFWVATVAEGKQSGSRLWFAADATEGSAVRVMALPSACTPPNDALKSLEEKVVDVEGATKNVADAIGKSTSEVEAYVADAKKELEKAVAKLPAATQDTIRTGVFWTRYVEELAASAVSSTVELAAVAPVLQSTIASGLRDPASRLRAYEVFAASLPTEDSFWSKPIANPGPVEGEARFPMSFVTPRQRYYLLAWNGLPMPIDKRSSVETDIHAENLIPLIDIMGWHWQGTRAYVPSTSFGFGLLGTRETVVKSDGTKELSNFNLGLQTSLSVASLRVGVAYVFRKDENAEKFFDTRNLRVVLGLDLVRLFTGKSLSASTSADVSNATDK